jgi:SAM-dependent methyltransferase
LWLFDQLELQPGMRVLEFGCGPGAKWMHNLDRLPDEITCILTDLSTGMVREAIQDLAHDHRFQYLVTDIQDAATISESFDAVIANHMLYHVPDFQRAVWAIHRVLKPGGVLFATTHGLRHMYDVYELAKQVAPDLRTGPNAAELFGLHNAAQKLAPAFSHVYVTVYPDFLWVTETEPLLAYIRSFWGPADLDDDRLAKLADLIENRIASEGGIHINKSSGLVKARRI